MFKCQICNKQCKSIWGLSSHVGRKHPKINKSDYYNDYIESTSICPVCNKNYRRFLDFGLGWSKTCSLKCKDKHPDRVKAISKSKKLEWQDPNSKINLVDGLNLLKLYDAGCIIFKGEDILKLSSYNY